MEPENHCTAPAAGDGQNQPMRSVLRVFAADAGVLADDALFALALQQVDPDRRKKAERFRQRKDQNLCLAAGLLLRRVLAGAGIPSPDFGEGENGKPFLKNAPDVHFNLSHSGTWVLCAVSAFPVGCDIEKVEKTRLSVARRFFSSGEAEHIFAADTPEEQLLRFYRCWVLKESFMKATGQGMSMGLDSFEIQFTPRGITARRGGKEEAVFFAESDLVPGYRCAVCGAPEIETAHFRVTTLF